MSNGKYPLLNVVKTLDKANEADQINIFHCFHTWYIVPSSNSSITPAVWLQMYQLNQWTSFGEFVIWLKSCWLLSPLDSCICPNGMKLYLCKKSLGLAVLSKCMK